MDGAIWDARSRSGSASWRSTRWPAASPTGTRRRAFQNGDDIVRLETRVTHRLYELTLQNFVDQKHWLETIVSWTYWNSEFTVLGLALLWVYLRRHESFPRFRNAILLANVFGLVGYILMPTAPPRLLGVGFTDQHRDGLVNLFANPYAAMPSLHAGDALIVGIVLATLCRRLLWKVVWCAWPAWIWFCVMATGNHFWLDCVAGSFVGLLAMARRVPSADSPLVCRSSGVTDRLPTRRPGRTERVVRSDR